MAHKASVKSGQSSSLRGKTDNMTLTSNMTKDSMGEGVWALSGSVNKCVLCKWLDRCGNVNATL